MRIKYGIRIIYYDSHTHTNELLDCYDQYSFNKSNGEYILWYANSRIGLHCHYKNDLVDGEYIEYFDSGQLESHCYYENGMKIRDV